MSSPTFDSELYKQATHKLTHHIDLRIRDFLDFESLSGWISEALSRAYESGLRDGYVQGRHDKAQQGEN